MIAALSTAMWACATESEMRGRVAVVATCLFIATAGAAEAHTAARGFVLLLPTRAIIFSGALAVLVSFVALSLAPDRWFRSGRRTFAPSDYGRVTSLLAAFILVLLLIAGFVGSTDPLANPLPLFIWTGWWVVFTVLHPLLGDLWRWFNPFSGLQQLWSGREQGPCRVPEPVMALASLGIFGAFAWWQLVWVTPEDPRQLAWLVSAYAVLTLLAGLVFGTVWFKSGDPFFQMFQMLGAVAPWRGWRPVWPGFGLLELPHLTVPRLVLVVLLLGTLSFDGLAGSFFWLDLIGVNPLDFPGRGAVMTANTMGLFGFVALLAGIIAICIAAGWWWAGKPGRLRRVASPLVLSLIPIAVALHFAHFLTDLLVNGQYLLFSLNDPFSLGWKLFAPEHGHVTTSFLNTWSGVWTIYGLQVAAILLGHMVAVAVAHAAVLRLDVPRAQSFKLELPMALLMVGYTGFSLWVLSTPSIA